MKELFPRHSLQRIAIMLAIGTYSLLPALAEKVTLQNPTATISQINGWNASTLTDGVTNDFAGWAVYDFSRNGSFSETAVVETASNVGFASGSRLTFVLYHVNHNPQHGLGRFRLSYTTDSRDTFADGLDSNGDVTANWTVLAPTSAVATGGETMTIQPDGSILVSGPNPLKTVYAVTAEVSARDITGFRIEALEDPTLPASGPGRYPSNGNFVLTEITAEIAPLSDDSPLAVAKVVNAIFLLPGSTNGVIISPDNRSALVILDASASSDAQNDPLTFAWFVGDEITPFATGVLTSNQFDLGQHAVTLVADDGSSSGTTSVTVDVITAAEALDEIILALQDLGLPPAQIRPLVSSLRNAQASFDRGNFDVGANQLRACQNKIRAQVAPDDPSSAAALSSALQKILDAIGH
jgi:hypothetical protein